MMLYTKYFSEINKELGFPKLTVHMFSWLMNIVAVENRLYAIQKARMNIPEDSTVHTILMDEEIKLYEALKKLTQNKQPEMVLSDILRGTISG